MADSSTKQRDSPKHISLHLHVLTNLRMQQVICNVHDLHPHINNKSDLVIKYILK